MIIKNSLDEVKKRETALNIIKTIINTQGRNALYDVTGLSGGFIAHENDLNLVETYVGPAIFEDELQIVGKEHLGGEKILAVNRTSAGILASILALVKKGDHVSHFLAKHPGHPSIPRSCEIVGASYEEFTDINKFYLKENTSLVVITGSTMDHQVIDQKTFENVVEIAHMKNIPVLVDDASGARLRTAVFKQKKATELGADLVVTSTDKLMPGPRGGIMSGKENLINKIKSKATQFGLEAQPPLILAMVNGIKNYREDNIIRAIRRKDELYDLLISHDFKMFEKTPTGIMVTKESLQKYFELSNIETKLSPRELCFLWGMILLKEEGIITIPAVGMPGASETIRFDLSSKDVIDIDLDILYQKISKSFTRFLNSFNNISEVKDLYFTKHL